MKKRFIILLVFGTVCISLRAQITITKENLPAIGTVSRMEMDTSGVNVSGLTAGGAVQTWNFSSNLKVVNTFDFKMVSPNNTPFGSKFSDASYAQLGSVERVHLSPFLVVTTPVDTMLQPYRFEKIEDTQVLGLGMELTVSVFNSAFRFKQPAVIYQLPIEMNKSWTYKAEIDTSVSYELVPGNPISIPVSLMDSANVSVDGTGLLTINSGTYSCLRLCYRWTRRFYVFGNEIVDWRDSRIIYKWVAGAIGSVLEITSVKNETNSAFTTASQVTRLVSTNVPVDYVCDPKCETSPLPRICNLEQNHPNPFNPETRIRYSLSNPSHVQLKVYNLLGREIAVLMDGFASAGDHVAVWNSLDALGRSVPSGIYIYRLAAVSSDGRSVVQTKKMILAR
jgi:hypothetical protein